jgi:hypothetical protein
MFAVVLSCLALLVVTTLIHFEVLTGLTKLLPAVSVPPRFKLVLVIVSEFASHALQIMMYGAAFWWLGRALADLPATGSASWSLASCLYFSAETFTSLGFGDLVPTGPMRLLAGAECLNGLLLIGWSASYSYIAMERYWKDDTR